jgi:transcriptional regulator GlxA family with amidase domain
MRIAILNYKDVVSTCVTGPADIIGGAMRMYPIISGKPLNVLFEIDFITDEEGQFWKKSLGSPTARKLSKTAVYDLVIIPAMRYDKIEEVLAREHRFITWIQQQHRKQANLASICIGTFMLAATGLLEGKKATTNWLFADQFRKMYPDVIMQDDKIIVDQGDIYSCGGAFSFTTFIMYLLEKFCGHEVAVVTSKILMINLHQQPQSTFSIFQLQHDHTDETIKKAQQFIESNYRESLTLEKMAGSLNMSTRNFIRRFEQATHNTPFEYLQRVRIEAAKKMLETTNKGIEQVAQSCGYDDMGFFRKVFKRHVAMLPKEYQEKYGKAGFKLAAS